MKQGSRFGDQFLQTHWRATHLPAPADRKYLSDKIPRPLTCTADFFEVAGRPAVRRELRFRHFRITEDRADDIVEVMGDTAGGRAERVDSNSQQAWFAGLRDDTGSQCIEAEDGADAGLAHGRNA